jgi:thiol:disulfide interchange protein DsbA
MKRREFSVAAASTVALSCLGLPGSVLAQARKPAEGTDYLTLEKRVPVEAPAGKIEVIEFFWYSCPHCNAFEPTLEPWIRKLPPDVAFRRVPVAFRDDFVPQQRLFYTLDALGKVDEMQAKVFNAIHTQHQSIDKEATIVAWAEKNGIDKAKFLELYNSFSVQTKARRATQLQDQYKVQGVPAIGIAGRFYTDGSMAGNMDRALQVTEYLVAEIRRGR